MHRAIGHSRGPKACATPCSMHHALLRPTMYRTKALHGTGDRGRRSSKKPIFVDSGRIDWNRYRVASRAVYLLYRPTSRQREIQLADLAALAKLYFEVQVG